MRVVFTLAHWVMYMTLLTLGLPLHADDAPPDRIVIIVNPSVHDQISKLPTTSLPAVFAMRIRTWSNESQIRVFVLAGDNPVHAAFCKQVLGVFPHQIRTAWDRLIYSGTGQPPTEVESEEEMRRRVASTPGAIGYLRKSYVDHTVTPYP